MILNDFDIKNSSKEVSLQKCGFGLNIFYLMSVSV